MYSIQEFYIDGYGIFNSYSKVLPNSKFILFYGQNQTGKSTLFSFLRGQLSGFNSFKTKENHYLPLNGGTHGGWIKVSDNSQSIYKISRYLKDKNCEIVSENFVNNNFRKEIESITVEDYRSLFAFDLNELKELTLLEKQELSEKLFTTGLWGANTYITSSLKDLVNSQLAIVKPRGRALLTELFDEYTVLEEEIKSFEIEQSKISDETNSYQLLKEKLPHLLKKREEITTTLDRLKKESILTNLKEKHESLISEINSSKFKLSLLVEDDIDLHSFYKKRAYELSNEIKNLYNSSGDHTKNSKVDIKFLDTLETRIEEAQQNEIELNNLEIHSRNSKTRLVFANIFLVILFLVFWILKVHTLDNCIYIFAPLSLTICLMYLLSTSLKNKALANANQKLDQDIEGIKSSFKDAGIVIKTFSLTSLKNLLADKKSSLIFQREQEIKLKNDQQLILNKIQALYNKYQVNTENEFSNLVLAFNTYRKLISRKDEFINVANSQGYSLEDFTKNTLSFSEIYLLQEKKKNELIGIDREIENTVHNIKDYEIRHNHLLSNDKIERKYFDLNAIKEKINREYRNWQTLAITESVLNNSFNSLFTAKCSELLSNSSRILSKVTSNNLISVSFDKSFSQIFINDSTGKTLSPSQLSRGSLEQLYLSIRLSLAQIYSKKFGAFPLLFDDILVNFDKVRAKATLETLLSFSQSNQIILFSCHEWIKELFLEVAGNEANVVSI